MLRIPDAFTGAPRARAVEAVVLPQMGLTQACALRSQGMVAQVADGYFVACGNVSQRDESEGGRPS